MPLVINTNVQSLNSQRQLVKSGMEMSQAMERLSSGRRINSAADDAAGLAISNRQTSQIRGLDRAVANANDGVSLIQTAEGALDETTSILQRMRELAVQSANGVYSNADRSTLDAEVQQLKAELSRIANTTSFNGQTILDGSLESVELQVGANAGEFISTSFRAMDASNLGGVGSTVTGQDLNQGITGITFTAGTVRINGQDLGTFSNTTAYSEATFREFETYAENKISGINVGIVSELQADHATSITDSGNFVTQATLTYVTADGSRATVSIVNQNSVGAAEYINSLDGALKASIDESGNLQLVGANIQEIQVSGASGFGFGSEGSVYGRITIDSTTGEEVTISFNTTVSAANIANFLSSTGLTGRSGDGTLLAGVTAAAAITVSEGTMFINDVDVGIVSAKTIEEFVGVLNGLTNQTGVTAELVAIGDMTTASYLKLTSLNGAEISVDYRESAGAVLASALGIGENNVGKTGGSKISAISIGSVDAAQEALGSIDQALEQINAQRADFGAIANRLESTMSNLMNISEQTSAARSRILDADFAAESANLSRAQVLQQASQAMLAQANAAPQQVLSLLR